MKISAFILLLILASCSGVKNEKFTTDEEFYQSLDLAELYKERYQVNRVKKEAVSHYINGLTEQQKGNWAEALIDFNLALAKDSSASILYSMSESYYKIGRTSLSIETLSQSLELNPDFIPSIELLASIYYSLGSIDHSIVMLERLVDLEPTLGRRLDLATYYQRMYPEKSIKLYQDIYEDTRSYEALKNLVDLIDQNDQPDDYLNVVRDYYYFNKSNTRAGMTFMDFLIKTDNSEEILYLLDSVDINIPTNDLDIFYGTVGFNILNDSLNSFNDEQIAKFVDRIDNRFHFNWRINFQAGYLAGKLNDYSKAHKYFQHTIKLSDTLSDIPIQVAVYYFNKNQNKLAEEILVESESRFPQDHRFPFFKGIAQYEQDRAHEALLSFKKSYELDNTFNDALTQIGLCYDKLGVEDSLFYYYEKALTLSPNDPLVKNNLAYSLSKRDKDLERALVLVQEALGLDPNNSAYLDTYAWILYKLGDYKQALQNDQFSN